MPAGRYREPASSRGASFLSTHQRRPSTAALVSAGRNKPKYTRLINAGVHFAPWRKASFASTSYAHGQLQRPGAQCLSPPKQRTSMSPWRKFSPSIFEMEAMFPAPNAAAGVAKARNTAKVSSSSSGVLSDMVMGLECFRSGCFLGGPEPVQRAGGWGDVGEEGAMEGLHGRWASDEGLWGQLWASCQGIQAGYQQHQHQQPQLLCVRLRSFVSAQSQPHALGSGAVRKPAPGGRSGTRQQGLRIPARTAS